MHNSNLLGITYSIWYYDHSSSDTGKEPKERGETGKQ